MTSAITGFQNVFKTIDVNKKREFLEKDFTLNRFLQIGGEPSFKENIFFTDPKTDGPVQSDLLLYKHMYMIKDASPQTIYTEIAKNIESKFENTKYTKFTKYQGSGNTIDETAEGENGTIRMIKGESFFVKNDSQSYHKLWTLSYPDFNPKLAGNQIVDHRTLVYEIIESTVNKGVNVNCLDELEDSRYINFSFNYADFMTAINFTNTDSIKATVKQIRISQLDAYSRNEDIPKDPNDK